jgi:hypothetical protein
MHRHGSYSRWENVSGQNRIPVQRYLCRPCGHTISVLPKQCLPYRPVPVCRLEADFNRRAEIGQGPDPPPGELEAGCLRRAWNRFAQRLSRLRGAFDQLLDVATHSAEELWRQIRRAKTSLPAILNFLAQRHKISLLGDYRCLQLPSG